MNYFPTTKQPYIIIIFINNWKKFVFLIFRYDNLNIDTILSSPRLVTNYVDCLMNKKPCPPEGKDLKRKFFNSFKKGFLSHQQKALNL